MGKIKHLDKALKAVKQDFYYSKGVDCYGDNDKSFRTSKNDGVVISFNLDKNCYVVEGNEGYPCIIREYGKTWALTKKELGYVDVVDEIFKERE